MLSLKPIIESVLVWGDGYDWRVFSVSVYLLLLAPRSRVLKTGVILCSLVCGTLRGWVFNYVVDLLCKSLTGRPWSKLGGGTLAMSTINKSSVKSY